MTKFSVLGLLGMVSCTKETPSSGYLHDGMDGNTLWLPLFYSRKLWTSQCHLIDCKRCFSSLSVIIYINVNNMCSIFMIILRTEAYTNVLSNSSSGDLSFTGSLSVFNFPRALKYYKSRRKKGLQARESVIRCENSKLNRNLRMQVLLL